MADEQTANDAAQTIRDELGKIGTRPEKEIRNPFSALVEKLCRPFAVPDVADTYISQRESVRIALVSMEPYEYKWQAFSTVLKADELSKKHLEACKRQLAEFIGDEPERMLAAFKEALTYALQELKADIVCVSELGLPSRGMLPVEEANEFARMMSDKYGALVIAGSVHDSRTLYNTAYLYYPGGDQMVHKGVSAVSVGENICTPSFRQVPVVEIFGLKIATMICLDVADFASIAAVIRYRDRVDVLLVPCQTLQFERMRDIAKVASRALRGLVILVNINQPQTMIAYIARFGNLTRLSSKALKSGALVSWLEEDVGEFKKTQILLSTPSLTPPPGSPSPSTEFPLDRRTSADDRIEWLFGMKERPTVY